MADKKDDDKGSAGGTGGTGDGGGQDRASVREMVADVLGDLFKGGKADVADKSDGGGKRGRDDAGDVQAQVDAAVKRVRDKDERDAAERKREERLAALEAKIAKPEKEPKVIRRVTAFMWGEEDD